MKPEQRKKLQQIIWSLETEEEIDEVGRMLRERWDHLVKRQVTSFQPGEDVRWEHKGQSHSGTVVKCNVKTVDVEEDGSGKMWRITATGLEHT